MGNKVMARNQLTEVAETLKKREASPSFFSDSYWRARMCCKSWKIDRRKKDPYDFLKHVVSNIDMTQGIYDDLAYGGHGPDFRNYEVLCLRDKYQEALYLYVDWETKTWYAGPISPVMLLDE